MQKLIEAALKEACALSITHRKELMSAVSGADGEKAKCLARDLMNMQAFFSLNKEPIEDNAENRSKLCEFCQITEAVRKLYS